MQVCATTQEQKQTNNSIKLENLIDIFHKKTNRWPGDILKGAQYHYQKTAAQNHKLFTLYLLEWLLSKRKETKKKKKIQVLTRMWEQGNTCALCPIGWNVN